MLKPLSVMLSGCTRFEWFVPRILRTNKARFGGVKNKCSTPSVRNSSTPKREALFVEEVSHVRIVVQSSFLNSFTREYMAKRICLKSESQKAKAVMLSTTSLFALSASAFSTILCTCDSGSFLSSGVGSNL